MVWALLAPRSTTRTGRVEVTLQGYARWPHRGKRALAGRVKSRPMETLRTARLTLSAPTMADAAAITAVCQDPAIQEWTTIPSPYNRSDAEGFVKIVADGWESGRRPNWALRLAGASQGEAPLVGMVGLVDEGAGSAELGFWLAPEGRGQGLMDEAVSAVCAYGFERLGLDRISWRAHVGNLGSAASARRAGLRYEGRMRPGASPRGARREQWRTGRWSADGAAAAAETCD